METSLVFSAFFYFVSALVLALLEIETEGKFGWGAKLPTWRKNNRLTEKLIPGRPATGYWLFVNLLVILFFHSSFFNGQSWSLEAEATAFSHWLIFLPVWDFCWFVFNPNYKLKNFKQENIAWFKGTKWFFGLMPMDYIFGILGSSAVAYYLDYLNNGWDNLIFNGCFVALIVPAIIFSPLYHRLYWRLRKDQKEA